MMLAKFSWDGVLAWTLPFPKGFSSLVLGADGDYFIGWGGEPRNESFRVLKIRFQ